MVKGRALARPSERSERFEPLVRTYCSIQAKNDSAAQPPDGVDGLEGLEGRDGLDGRDGLEARDALEGREGLEVPEIASLGFQAMG
ncbi:hypothetical protein D9M68_631180 [compost metagenome]